jgi:predicted PurR-regulated permease PerM
MTAPRTRPTAPAERIGPAEVRLGALALLTLLLFYVCWLIARPFFAPLVWGGVLALVTHPVHRWMAARVPRPNLAAGLAVAVIALGIVIPVLGLVAALAHEARKGAEVLSAGELRARWDGIKRSNPRLAPVFERLEKEIPGTGGAPAREGQGTAGSEATEDPGGTRGGRGLVSNTIRGATEFLITFFVLFFLFRDRDAVRRALVDLMPMPRRRAERVLRRVADAVWGITYGTLVVAAVQGVLGGAMFWFLGLPAPVLWGVVMALLALVPVLGPFVVWVPAAAFLALEGSWGKALILTAWGAVVIGLVDNVLYPSLVAGRLRLHTLVVFISILGGLSLFGASGLFLGPALVTFALEIRRLWRVRARARRNMAAVVGG